MTFLLYYITLIGITSHFFPYYLILLVLLSHFFRITSSFWYYFHTFGHITSPFWYYFHTFSRVTSLFCYYNLYGFRLRYFALYSSEKSQLPSFSWCMACDSRSFTPWIMVILSAWSGSSLKSRQRRTCCYFHSASAIKNQRWAMICF